MRLVGASCATVNRFAAYSWATANNILHHNAYSVTTGYDLNEESLTELTAPFSDCRCFQAALSGTLSTVLEAATIYDHTMDLITTAKERVTAPDAEAKATLIGW